MIINTLSHDNWATPKWFYDKLDAEFHFDFDPCPLNNTFDGLDQNTEWGKCNFVNPLYSRKLKNEFIYRAYFESEKGKTSVLLLPVSTSTKVFHTCILPFAEIRFVRGRLKFVENGKEVKQTGTRDSMIVIFRGKNNGK